MDRAGPSRSSVIGVRDASRATDGGLPGNGKFGCAFAPGREARKRLRPRRRLRRRHRRAHGSVRGAARGAKAPHLDVLRTALAHEAEVPAGAGPGAGPGAVRAVGAVPELPDLLVPVLLQRVHQLVVRPGPGSAPGPAPPPRRFHSGEFGFRSVDLRPCLEPRSVLARLGHSVTVGWVARAVSAQTNPPRGAGCAEQHGHRVRTSIEAPLTQCIPLPVRWTSPAWSQDLFSWASLGLGCPGCPLLPHYLPDLNLNRT